MFSADSLSKEFKTLKMLYKKLYATRKPKDAEPEKPAEETKEDFDEPTGDEKEKTDL